jgi:hypothetical protein
MSDQKTKNTICENLEFCKERLSLIQKQYCLCAESLAEHLWLEHNRSNIASIYEEFKSLLPIDNGAACAIFFKTVIQREQLASRNKYDALFELLGINESAQPGSHGRISFVRNKYNDAAFENFSRIVRNSKFSYAPSFAAACEDVISGVCEYAILPIENSSDGRLFGFYSLLDRYELHICAVNSLETNDDPTSNIRFALVGKTAPKRIGNDALCEFEFSIARENSNRLVDLLYAAYEFSATPKKIDTLSLEYDHNLYKHYLTFSIPCQEAYAFALYLSLEYPNYTPIGFYQAE